MLGIDPMVARKAFKCGSIDVPIVLAQMVCGLFIKLQMFHDVVRHSPIHYRKNMCRCVMERVV